MEFKSAGLPEAGVTRWALTAHEDNPREPCCSLGKSHCHVGSPTHSCPGPCTWPIPVLTGVKLTYDCGDSQLQDKYSVY